MWSNPRNFEPPSIATTSTTKLTTTDEKTTSTANEEVSQNENGKTKSIFSISASDSIAGKFVNSWSMLIQLVRVDLI